MNISSNTSQIFYILLLIMLDILDLAPEFNKQK